MTTFARSQAGESKGLAKYKQELESVRVSTFDSGETGLHDIEEQG